MPCAVRLVTSRIQGTEMFQDRPLQLQSASWAVQPCPISWALLWPGFAYVTQTVQGTVTRVVAGDTVWAEDARAPR